jgi:hypothetical protein
MSGMSRRFAAVIATIASITLASGALGASDTFDPVTSGGLRPGTHIYSVTNLRGSGGGSLFAALRQPGPKIIVFEVGGIIELNKDLSVETPFTTIAGETAPAPGIVLSGAGLHIRTHDVVVRHIAIRPRPSDNEKINESRDGLSIGGNPERYGAPIRNVVVENVSVSWGIDENVSIWNDNSGNVQLRSMLIGEGLVNGGHPEGPHSMGMLVGSDIDSVTITDSLFVSNNDRHPRVSPRAQVSAERNVVANPGKRAIQVFVDCADGQAPMRFADNVLRPGPDTRVGISLYDFRDDSDEDREIAYGDPSCDAGWRGISLSLADEARQLQIVESVLAHAGSRPVARDRIDDRLILEARGNSGRFRDEPEMIAAGPPGDRVFVMPDDPLAQDSNGRLAIEKALCSAHLSLGGLPSLMCS